MTEEREKELINKVAKQIVKLKFTTPAVFFLESMKPMSFVGSSMLNFLSPFVSAIFTFKDYDDFATLLENRENIEKLIIEIERLENECLIKEKEIKEQEKQEKIKNKK